LQILIIDKRLVSSALNVFDLSRPIKLAQARFCLIPPLRKIKANRFFRWAENCGTEGIFDQIRVGFAPSTGTFHRAIAHYIL